jgi:hypothetical protein
MKPTIAIAGSLAQKPHQAGHTWQFLQYLLGFQRLGFDVLFIDRLELEMCVAEDGTPLPIEQAPQLAYLRSVMDEYGLADRYALLADGGTATFGLAREDVLRRVESSELLLNVMGFLDDADVLAAAPRRVFLDTDPGYGQMWLELGLADIFAGHEDLVTIAENIGRPGCDVPTCGRDWITTPQPVVLDQWPAQPPAGERLTSIGSWRGPYGPLEFRGKTYGLRVHEFRKFAGVPRRTDQEFEVALDIDPVETSDLELLRAGGWRVVDPRPVGHSPAAYREYIQGSKGEFMVARGMYVTARSGWFSERSMCYLATGKPVLAQDTGLGDLYPVGEGLLTFDDAESATEAVEALAGDYATHARAARALAERFFHSDRVLTTLLEKLGVSTPIARTEEQV